MEKKGMKKRERESVEERGKVVRKVRVGEKVVTKRQTPANPRKPSIHAGFSVTARKVTLVTLVTFRADYFNLLPQRYLCLDQ